MIVFRQLLRSLALPGMLCLLLCTACLPGLKPLYPEDDAVVDASGEADASVTPDLSADMPFVDTGVDPDADTTDPSIKVGCSGDDGTGVVQSLVLAQDSLKLPDNKGNLFFCPGVSLAEADWFKLQISPGGWVHFRASYKANQLPKGIILTLYYVNNNGQFVKVKSQPPLVGSARNTLTEKLDTRMFFLQALYNDTNTSGLLKYRLEIIEGCQKDGDCPDPSSETCQTSTHLCVAK